MRKKTVLGLSVFALCVVLPVRSTPGGPASSAAPLYGLSQATSGTQFSPPKAAERDGVVRKIGYNDKGVWICCSEGKVPLRPFNIVAIGDSIMWGQGLSHGSKFTTKVAYWLQSQLGIPAPVHSVAHSGATLVPDSSGSEDTILNGEVPYSFPTISHQASVLAPAMVKPEDVDLVLMDGCINDVGVATILNPVKGDDELRGKTQGACFNTMVNAMTAVAQKFPNAKVVVPGYYPIVSRQSNLLFIVPLLLTLSVITAAVVPPDPIGDLLVTLYYRHRAATRSKIFAEESTKALQQAVDILNQHASSRFRFVPIPFSDDNAYAADNTLLWKIPSPVEGPGAVDEVFYEREQSCMTTRNSPPTCIPASMGHPNVAGAQVYADAITGVLTQLLAK